jgi:hypothetical protein
VALHLAAVLLDLLPPRDIALDDGLDLIGADVWRKRVRAFVEQEDEF